ncbi:MAG: superoxide dismutase [Actinomycetota bacterium]|nr:superoxide dismutase [Actinomycetota bacterium]
MIDFETTNRALQRAVLSVIVLVLALTLATCGGGTGGDEDAGQDETPSSAGRYVLPGEEVYPEGVTYDPQTGNFFVGSTTDGTVFRGDVGDDGEAEVFLEPGGDGRETAIGMEVDERDRLFIAGGDTGQIFVYDAASGGLIRAFDTPRSQITFINDVAVTPGGDAYFTDSMRPILFRVPATPDGVGEPEEWLNFGGTPAQYEEGFNLNGIVATEDGRYLITVQSNTGRLYRIDTASKEVVEIDLGTETLTNGDGLLLDGQTLYVVRNQQGLIVPVELSEDLSSGEVGEGISDPSFRYPTTIARAGDRLLVVNSQFDRRQSGQEPELPFTVSSIEVPQNHH